MMLEVHHQNMCLSIHKGMAVHLGALHASILYTPTTFLPFVVNNGQTKRAVITYFVSEVHILAHEAQDSFLPLQFDTHNILHAF